MSEPAQTARQALEALAQQSWDDGARAGTRVVVRSVLAILDAQETLGNTTIPTSVLRAAVEALPEILDEIMKSGPTDG